MPEHIIAALRVYLSSLWQILELPLILLLFLCGALVYYRLHEVRRNNAVPGFRSAIAFAFRRDLYRNPTTVADMWHFVWCQLVWIPLMSVLLGGVGSVISATAIYAWLGGQAVAAAVPHASIWTTALQVLVLFLCSEFCTYVAHWALHRVPVLWSIHRVHHSAEALTVFTRLRDHPLDLVFLASCRLIGGSAMGGAIFFAAGSPPVGAALTIYLLIGLLVTFGLDLWRHCHLPISLGRLDHVINSPVMHQIHHSAEERHWDRNLGGELMIFDWLFGTLYVPTPGEQYRWGLNDAEMGLNNPHLTMRGFYLEPFGHAWRRLHGRGKVAASRSKAIEPTMATQIDEPAR